MEWVLQVHEIKRDEWVNWVTGSLEDCLEDLFELRSHFSSSGYDELRLSVKRPEYI